MRKNKDGYSIYILELKKKYDMSMWEINKDGNRIRVCMLNGLNVLYQLWKTGWRMLWIFNTKNRLLKEQKQPTNGLRVCDVEHIICTYHIYQSISKDFRLSSDCIFSRYEILRSLFPRYPCHYNIRLWLIDFFNFLIQINVTSLQDKFELA